MQTQTSKHAEEDAWDLGEAETHKKANILVAQTEKLLRYQAENIGHEDKADIEAKLSALKNSREGEDDEAISDATLALVTASQRFRQKLFEQASADEAAANAAGASDNGQPGGADGKADIEIIDDGDDAAGASDNGQPGRADGKADIEIIEDGDDAAGASDNGQPGRADGKATVENSSYQLTRSVGEILSLMGEQAQRAAEEAEAERAGIRSAAHAEAATVIAEAEAARQAALDAVVVLRRMVAENIGVGLALHEELGAALAIDNDASSVPDSVASATDPLAQVLRDAVGRASTSPS